MSYEMKTSLGSIRGNDNGCYCEFLGVTFAKARRFEYAVPVDLWDGVLDATKIGDACPQYRTYFQDLSIPDRNFFYKEFCQGIDFTYSENCLNLNIYAPKAALENGVKSPVIVFIHGGGFNSGANSESYDGQAYAARGIVFVSINYRVGIFGYLAHEEIKKTGRDGNFGLDDQLVALQWIKKHISDFGGDNANITVMGQSAGALSIQDLCLSSKAAGLFQKAFMISGAGQFPSFAAPRNSEMSHPYWNKVIEVSGAKSFDEFKTIPTKDVLAAVEKVKKIRKDDGFCTMPVIDGYLLEKPLKKLFRNPLKIEYMVSTTNNDMYACIFYNMARKFIKRMNGWFYFFDVDAPGDKNKAFHSSDLRYLFGTLKKSWRPYDERDNEISRKMIEYTSNFAKTGNPNGPGLPLWERGGCPLVISKDGITMGKPSKWKLICNTFHGEPK